MKEIVILSGKGGTGKTTIVGSFAALAKGKVLADCDVDAADLHLLLSPSERQKTEFWSGHIAYVDEDKCTGCQVCIDACPYNVITYDDNRDVIWKCILCHHRIDEGLEPFCVICCEDEALFFGDLNDQESQVSKLIIQKSAYILKPEKGTTPAVYYCRETSRVSV